MFTDLVPGTVINYTDDEDGTTHDAVVLEAVGDGWYEIADPQFPDDTPWIDSRIITSVVSFGGEPDSKVLTIYL